MTIKILLASLLLSLSATFHSQAQISQPHAGVLEVTYAGVSVQRQDTEAWITVRSGSIMPIGTGDRIRTNTSGRAFIYFDDALTMLVLPSTEIYVEDFSIDDQQQLSIIVHSAGLVVHRVLADERIRDYTLYPHADLKIIQPAQNFATWSNPDEDVSVTVAEGVLELEHAGQTAFVETNQGYSTAYDEVISLVNRLPHSASIVVQVAGCTAQVNTREGRNLTIRNAPTVSTSIVGYIPNNDIIEIVGISEDGQRFRTRYYSVFGWVEALGVDSNCENLPVYPVSFMEFYREAINITDEELNFTLPFWGRLSDEPLFYRFEEEAPDGE